MSKVFGIGDLHFTSNTQWHYEAGKKFISWFKKQNWGNKENIAIFAGDIFHSDINPGESIDQVDELFNFCSETFKKTFVIPGNHDRQLFKEKDQYAIKFLDNKKDVQVVDTLKEINIDGYDILFMPHVKPYRKTLEEYYSNLPKEYYDKTYDIVTGHFSERIENNIFMKNGVDISKIKTKAWFLGHIHTRMLSDKYMGSVWPVIVSENISKPERCIKCYENGKTTEIYLPKFLEYKEINYPDKIVDNTDSVKVWTIKNCQSMNDARKEYPDAYIRACEAPIEEMQKNGEDQLFVFKNNKEAFDAMIGETEKVISRKTYSLVSSLL